MAQQAYSSLSADDAGDYSQLKDAILRQYDINAETYQRRFRSQVKEEETY
jgi:biotin synthase-like enzyme